MTTRIVFNLLATTTILLAALSAPKPAAAEMTVCNDSDHPITIAAVTRVGFQMLGNVNDIAGWTRIDFGCHRIVSSEAYASAYVLVLREHKGKLRPVDKNKFLVQEKGKSPSAFSRPQNMLTQIDNQFCVTTKAFQRRSVPFDKLGKCKGDEFPVEFTFFYNYNDGGLRGAQVVISNRGVRLVQ